MSSMSPCRLFCSKFCHQASISSSKDRIRSMPEISRRISGIGAMPRCPSNCERKRLGKFPHNSPINALVNVVLPLPGKPDRQTKGCLATKSKASTPGRLSGVSLSAISFGLAMSVSPKSSMLTRIGTNICRRLTGSGSSLISASSALP